jgi:dihydrofolate synthase/folylpolyglutamate synthase
MTTVAFSAFAEARIDVAIVEVGLGGRLDATNIVRPVACVIPSIGLDHQKFLGRTLSAIAAEKAGILKRRVPCVIGSMSPRAASRIAERARTKAVQLFDAGRLCKVRKYEVRDGLNVLSISAGKREYDDLHCKLVGRHQINNTLCAVLTVELLTRRGFEIPESALRQGLENVDWPGRFQIFRHEPTLILDVAHNSAGMRALVQTMREVYPGVRPVVVLGVLADKDYRGMLGAWQGAASHILCCQVNSPRALPAEKLHSTARKLNVPSSVSFDALAAVREAARRVGKGGVVCVTGSHYVVGQVLENTHAAAKEKSAKMS